MIMVVMVLLVDHHKEDTMEIEDQVVLDQDKNNVVQGN